LYSLAFEEIDPRSRAEKAHGPAGTGVICEAWALQAAVIPAKAGIYPANLRKCAVDGLDSRFRGNDRRFEGDPIPNDTNTALRVISTLGANPQYPWCGKVPTRLRLPSGVHSASHYRVWQRRFDPFGVYSEKKRLEKLNYAHRNAMKNGASQLSLPVTCHSPLAIAPVGGGSGIGSSLVPALRDHSPLLSWPWSSFRFYYLQDSSLLRRDRVD
jgi:hypothetical protein